MSYFSMQKNNRKFFYGEHFFQYLSIHFYLEFNVENFELFVSKFFWKLNIPRTKYSDEMSYVDLSVEIL